MVGRRMLGYANNVRGVQKSRAVKEIGPRLQRSCHVVPAEGGLVGYRSVTVADVNSFRRKEEV